MSNEKTFEVVGSGRRFNNSYQVWESFDLKDLSDAALARSSCDLADANRRAARMEEALREILSCGSNEWYRSVAEAALAPLEGEEEKQNDKTTS